MELTNVFVLILVAIACEKNAATLNCPGKIILVIKVLPNCTPY